MDDSVLYRGIKRSKPMCVRKNGTISSALFKDPDGVSVDIKGGRTKEVVISDMQANFPKTLKGIVSLLKLHIDQADIYLCLDPSLHNPYHALMFKNKEKEELTPIQQLQLADSCELIYWDANKPWIYLQ